MEHKVIDFLKGSAAESIELAENIFGVEFNEALVHQIATAYLAGSRAGTRAQKRRGEVRGGGIKPWRQKGTGRARAGSIRSPLWRKGGVTFAAKPQDHSQKVNKKMYRGALCSIWSELIRQERLIVVEEITLDSYKTRDLLTKLATHNLNNVLIVTHALDENLYLAARNLPHVEACAVEQIDPISLIGFENVLVTREALKRIEEVLV